MKTKTFKITSRFYVIYGDYEPIYVGYTNRAVRQRFAEHKHDKDFSDYDNIEVKELVDAKLSFEFTWDYEKTCKNADEVSLREGQLVQQYGTQSSEYQKVVEGGQAWASEKGFVKHNKDNPKFAGMSGLEIKACLKEEKVASIWLGNFVSNMKPIEEVWLGSFISTMNPIEEVWLGSFVSTMKPINEQWLRDFVGNMKPVEEVWLGSFIGNMKSTEKQWLGSFVGNMMPTEERWLGSFVKNMEPIEERWLRNFVGHMKPVEEVWLENFVGNMKSIEEVWISNFVGHMKHKRR